MNKVNATNNDNFKIFGFEWYVPHYTPSMEQQKIRSKEILSKITRELQYLERSIFMKEINTQSFWKFELTTKEGINVPI